MDDIKKLQAVRKLASELESKVEQKQAKAQQSTMQAIDLVVSAFKKFKEDVKAQMEVVRSIPPEKGDKGEKGDPGLPGPAGRDGKDGKDGKDGQDGQDGVSVVDARLDFDGHLVMVLSNGTEIDAGVLAPEKASEIYATLKQTIDGGGGSALTISDEGVTLTSGATKINFVGAAVTASATGDEVTVNVSAGTGSVTSVDLSVPTGLSVSGSPITTSGTIAISLQSGYSIPTTASQTNWDAAYGWGNHASAGYLTTESDPTVPSHVKAISTTNISNWNDAYTDRLKWDGGATGLNATTGRTSLGLGTAATMTGPSGTIVGTTDTQTLTNKRINPRVTTPGATSGNFTANGDTSDVFDCFGLTGAITFLTPSGTPVNGQRLMIRIEDNGSSRGITWTTSSGAFRAVGVTLPTATTASKITYVGCVYNSTDVFWDVIAVITQA